MDSIIIFPPGPSVAGSQLQLGTYLDWLAGADYGAKGLIQSQESTNALRDGGVFAFRNVGPRQMSFPLLLRDVPGQTLLQTETLLRRWTTAGAAVAVQPETTPSGQAVFFDVLDGRWEPAYDGFENRSGHRRGTLFLDTQPWGYWPTEILLASAASVGQFGSLAVSGASMIGDIAPLLHVQVSPTSASSFPGGSYVADMIGVSFAGRPSFSPFIPPGSIVAYNPAAAMSIVGSLGPDKFAPASQAIFWGATTDGAGGNGWRLSAWVQLGNTGSFIPSALEPAYRGRFRVFAPMRTISASSPNAIQTIIDSERTTGSAFIALASGNQLASVQAFVPSSTDGGVYSASPAYQLMDMGEITLPPGGGSGVQGDIRLRLWASIPSALPSGLTQLALGGLYLFPVDAAAGILTTGVAIPSLNQAGTVGGVEWNANFVEGVSVVKSGLVSGAAPVYRSGLSAFRGVAPRGGASVNQMSLITADRSARPGQTFLATNEYSQVSVSYRPTFQFLYGI